MKDLPEKTYVDIPVELSKEERKIYDAVRTEVLSQIDLDSISKIDAGTINFVLVKMTRLQQVCDGCELIGEETKSSKLETLKELLETLHGEKVAVFTKFSQMANILARELVGYKPVVVTGDTPQEARLGLIKQFEDGDGSLCISTNTLAYGVNMQFCHIIINYDLDYSIDKFEQKVGRIDRVGQKNSMTIYSLIVKNSMDTFVKNILLKKQKTAEEIYEGLKNCLKVDS